MVWPLFRYAKINQFPRSSKTKKLKATIPRHERCLLFVSVIDDIGSGGSRISQRGVRQPQRGAPTYYLPNFYQKLHENEKNLAERGAQGTRAPLRSATDWTCCYVVILHKLYARTHARTLGFVHTVWKRVKRRNLSGMFVTCPCKLNTEITSLSFSVNDFLLSFQCDIQTESS